MSYDPFDFFWTDAPSAISQAEAKKSLPVFRSIIPKRFEVVINQLGMSQEEAFADPELAFIRCAEWQRSQMTFELRSEEEVREIEATHRKIVSDYQANPIDISGRSVRVAYDVGFFLGEMIIHSVREFEWQIRLRPKSAVDLHMPILVHPQFNYSLSPVLSGITMAYELRDHSESQENLFEAFTAMTQRSEKFLQHQREFSR